MLCPHCGAANMEGAGFCRNCRRTIHAGEGLATPAAGGVAFAAPDEPGPVYTYAAFWPRFGAWLLDLLFSLLIAAVPAAVLALVLAVAVAASYGDARGAAEQDERDTAVGTGIVGGLLIGYLPVFFAYHTIANAKGGGWGKRIAGLRVLRERDGALPGYGSGFLRIFITMVISSINLLWLLDHLWCVWDAQKQTWHDKIAGTVVVAT